MAELDESQEALRNVEEITGSDRDNGEDLLESEDLKRQLGITRIKQQQHRIMSAGLSRPASNEWRTMYLLRAFEEDSADRMGISSHQNEIIPRPKLFSLTAFFNWL